MKIKHWILIGLLILGFAGILSYRYFFDNSKFKIGQPIDSFNGVYVYYNGRISNVSGRSIAKDNYNLGLKYQCVEFVKRYYYQHLKHRMPNSYGHAKDFFNKKLKDGELNKDRNLIQYSNPSKSKPKVDDLLIFSGTTSNMFGHVAIISKASNSGIEIIQQNPGPRGKSKATFLLSRNGNSWKINNGRILGWLRKE